MRGGTWSESALRERSGLAREVLRVVLSFVATFEHFDG